MQDLPYEFKYTPDHLWVNLEDEQTTTLGVTEVFMSMFGHSEEIEFGLSAGEEFDEGDLLVTLTNDDSEIEVYAPVSGELLEINSDLIESPEILNEHPYGQGWLIRFETENKSEFADLMSMEEYESLVRDESEDYHLEEDEELELEDDDELDFDEEEEEY